MKRKISIIILAITLAIGSQQRPHQQPVHELQYHMGYKHIWLNQSEYDAAVYKVLYSGIEWGPLYWWIACNAIACG